MAKNLVIVESPAKAKTIESYLGKDFLVKSSYGHVRDLSEKGLSVDIENNFAPLYVVPEDKKKVIVELKKLSKQAETVWLASDEDREGEAISWHLAQALGLDENKTKRIVFNEITKTAILKAIENPRSIDYNLVKAQQARRVLDRLVGYELSPILWKKVKPSLSAGRVQSVAVRLIVERERERNAFKIQSYYRVVALFSANGKTFRAELSKRFDSKEQAQAFLNQCKTANFSVHSVEQKPGIKSPSAPFTTSTLQQEASRKLGFSVARTMQLAQKLYESGKITYMRTDSVNMSDFALQSAKAAIHKMYGNEYHQRRQFSTKTKGAQEAHECIRPTDMSVPSAGAEASEIRLYELIWKRSIASQMSNAKLEKTIITVSSPQHNMYFSAKGEVIKFEGFLKVYLEGTDDEEEDQQDQQDQQLPDVRKGDALQVKEITATERFTSPPPRFTEASLVKKLEELGIGRPSTYAPTISTIQNRGYVVKEDRLGETRKYHVLSLRNNQLIEEIKEEITGAEKNKLFPTDIGALVNDFLVEHFGKIVDYNFTASVEKEFDEIASGKLKWEKMIKGFYYPFHESVEETEKKSKRVTGKRELGIDAASGKKVYALIGKFGPMIQIGEIDEEEKPRYASLRKGQSIESITLDQALDLFKLPRFLGQFEGKDIVVGIGRFGPYIRHDGKFVSIPKDLDPMEIDESQAIQLILEKRNAEQNRIIQSFEDGSIQILRGRFGPYINNGERNYKIPKGAVPDKLTLDEVKEIIKTSKPSGKSAKKVPLKKESTQKEKPKKAAAAKKKATPVKKKKPATQKKSTTNSK